MPCRDSVPKSVSEEWASTERNGKKGGARACVYRSCSSSRFIRWQQQQQIWSLSSSSPSSSSRLIMQRHNNNINRQQHLRMERNLLLLLLLLLLPAIHPQTKRKKLRRTENIKKTTTKYVCIYIRSHCCRHWGPILIGLRQC